MKAVKVLVIIVAIVISGSLFLWLPAQYQLNINSEQYFEKCAEHARVDESLCEKRQVPAQITGSAPFLSAWWTKTEMHRSLAQKDVTSQWGPQASKMIFRNALISLLPVVGAVGFAFIPSSPRREVNKN